MVTKFLKRLKNRALLENAGTYTLVKFDKKLKAWISHPQFTMFYNEDRALKAWESLILKRSRTKRKSIFI